eukprot:3755573-Lingulodinium_polyedra.AAC.1
MDSDQPHRQQGGQQEAAQQDAGAPQPRGPSAPRGPPASGAPWRPARAQDRDERDRDDIPPT